MAGGSSRAAVIAVILVPGYFAGAFVVLDFTPVASPNDEEDFGGRPVALDRGHGGYFARQLIRFSPPRCGNAGVTRGAGASSRPSLRGRRGEGAPPPCRPQRRCSRQRTGEIVLDPTHIKVGRGDRRAVFAARPELAPACGLRPSSGTLFRRCGNQSGRGL